jgi:hypothetical protein
MEDSKIQEINEKAELLNICFWITQTDEYKEHEISEVDSMFYYVPVLEYAKLIQKFIKEKPFEI